MKDVDIAKEKIGDNGIVMASLSGVASKSGCRCATWSMRPRPTGSS